MLNRILGKEIAFYVRGNRGMITCAIILTAIAAILVVIPAYLIQPFVDEGMKSGSDPVAWKIPWVHFESGSRLSWQRTERVLVEGISPNRLLIILTFVAFVSIFFKSVAVYIRQHTDAYGLSKRNLFSLVETKISLDLG